jgi:hypothetical protein
MKITTDGISVVRVYSTADGESHLEDIEHRLATTDHGITEKVAVDGVVLRVWHDNPDQPRFHVAPRRQLVIHLSGSAEVRASDGSTRHLETGSILLTEDTEGKGHTVRGVDLPRMAMFVPLPDKRETTPGRVW